MDNKTLLDIVFHGKGLSRGQRREIEEEMMASGAGSPMEESMFEDLWNECGDASVSRADIKGMRRLHREISGHRHNGWAIAFAAVASVAVIFFTSYLTFSALHDDAKEITVITAQGSRGTYTMPDGTVVRLNGGSSLTFDESFNRTDRKARISGSAFFDVARNPDKPFVLSLNNVSLKVLGTSFTVVNSPGSGREEVVLRSGSVQVEAQGQSLMMEPGDMISYSDDGRIVKTDVNASQLCRWWEDCLVFDNAPLDEIISSLGLRFQMDIRNHSSVSSGTRLSMTVANESLDDVMSMLSMLLPVKYQIYDNSVLITNK